MESWSIVLSLLFVHRTLPSFREWSYWANEGHFSMCFNSQQLRVKHLSSPTNALYMYICTSLPNSISSEDKCLVSDILPQKENHTPHHVMERDSEVLTWKEKS